MRIKRTPANFFDSIYEKRCVKHWIVDNSVSRIVILIGKEWLNLFFVTINQGECTSKEEANQRSANEYSFASVNVNRRLRTDIKMAVAV